MGFVGAYGTRGRVMLLVWRVLVTPYVADSREYGSTAVGSGQARESRPKGFGMHVYTYEVYVYICRYVCTYVIIYVCMYVC